jgi:4-aminobutyrate aminotransferase/(S)-3-amino-2-methylpropionate transaminase
MDETGPGSLGGTFGGNPLSCAAALAAIKAIEDDHLNERAMLLGERFRKRAHAWQRKFPCVGDVRGIGAMQAFEIVKSGGSRTPDAETTKRITRDCYEHGVILVTAGTYGNIIRLLMPLVITDNQLEEALDVIESALAFARQAQPVHREVPAAAL